MRNAAGHHPLGVRHLPPQVGDFVRVPLLLISGVAPEGAEAQVTKSGKSRRVPVAHDLGHTAPCLWLGNGVDPVTVGRRVAHAERKVE
jgi:hypothetical protein